MNRLDCVNPVLKRQLASAWAFDLEVRIDAVNPDFNNHRISWAGLSRIVEGKIANQTIEARKSMFM